MFNGSGTALTYNNDGPTPGEASSTDSWLSYTFTTAGTYYLGVSAYSNTSYNATTGASDKTASTAGAYTLKLIDGTDSDDQIGEAHAVTIGQTISDAINPWTDVDMWAVTVYAGQTLTFDIDRPTGSTLNSYIRLFNATGTQLTYNDDGVAPGETSSNDSYLSYTFATAGTYYLGVSAYSNTSYSATTGASDRTTSNAGAYTLTVAAGGDLDDQITEAAALAGNGETINGTLGTGTDVDMYAVTVDTNQRVFFDTGRPSGGTFDAYIRVFDANGNQLAYNNDGPTPGEATSKDSYLAYTFATAGTYYLGVSGSGNSAYSPVTGLSDSSGSSGAYTLRVSRGISGVLLTSVAWSGDGQVQMRKHGADSWQNDAYTDAGDRLIPSGPDAPVWLDANQDGDAADTGDVSEPVAFVRNAQPTLRAVFVAPDATSLPVVVRATSTDAGATLVFTGAGDLAVTATLDLVSTSTVGSAVQNRDVALRWEVSVDGGATYQDVGTTTHHLFVLYAQPLDANNHAIGDAANSPTAVRIQYAAALAAGQATIMNIAQKKWPTRPRATSATITTIRAMPPGKCCGPVGIAAPARGCKPTPSTPSAFPRRSAMSIRATTHGMGCGATRPKAAVWATSPVGVGSARTTTTRATAM